MSRFTLPLPHRSPSRSRYARGFTLIEVLVVIGIILILIGLFFAGMKHWRATSDRHNTSIRMQILVGWLADLRSTSPNTYKAYFVDTTYANIDATSSFGYPTKPSPGPYGDITTNTPANRALVTNYMLTNSGGSSGLMAFLMKQPSVVQSFSKLPSDAVENGVVLDGWGNPILYVPAAGISYNGVNVTAPDGGPFFVSAGPDGNISTPADNVYSYEP